MTLTQKRRNENEIENKNKNENENVSESEHFRFGTEQKLEPGIFPGIHDVTCPEISPVWDLLSYDSTSVTFSLSNVL